MKVRIVVLIGFLFVTCKAQEVIPSHIGDLTVKVTPPGNEFYQAPPPKVVQGKLPELIEQKVKTIALASSRISSWDTTKEGGYTVSSATGEDRYRFGFTREGMLSDLSYRNYSLFKQEVAARMIVRGTKQSVSLSEIPAQAIATLEKLGLNPASATTFVTNTIEGKRFGIVIDGMAYYARPDGQIQTAGSVSKGALNENDSSNNISLKTHAEIISGCDSVLSKYRDRFNFGNEIKTLKSVEKSEGGFRFIAMGDNRSNEDVWFNMVKHIDLLQPKPDFIINSGDLVAGGYARQFAEYLLPPLLATNIPFFVAIGNHDCGIKDSVIEYRYLFGDNSLNYFFDHGKFRFIMFDNVSRMGLLGESLPWLEKVLAETPKDKSILVFAHQPPSVIERWAWHAWDKKSSTSFVALMSKYHVTHVFLGHIHGYSTATIDGVPYTISGGGGAELYDRFGVEGNVHHYVICDAMPDGTIKQKVVKFYKDAR
jgi:hypothetical protein